MRQTNNAINLLNASYQAVFKHAYITGLASSVALLSVSPYAVAATSFADNVADASKTDFVYNSAQAAYKDRNTTGYANNITITGQTGNSGANADVGLNIKTSASANTDIRFLGKLDVTDAFLNISGSDTYGATLTGSLHSNEPIQGSLEFNGSKLNISHGKVAVNQAEFSGSVVNISGSVGNAGHQTQDLFVNYSALRTGKIEANSAYQGQAGETTFSNTDVNLGDFSALDAMGDITFERGTITIKAAKDTNGTNKTIGEIAAKAIIRADEFNLNTFGTLHVGNTDSKEAAGAVYAETTNLNTGSKLEIASGATLQLAGQISQKQVSTAAVPEGDISSKELAINTTIGAGKLNIQSNLTNKGDLILGANSVNVNGDKTLNHYSSSQYDVTQSAGTVNNYGTLSLGEGINKDYSNQLDASHGTTYTLTGGNLKNSGSAEIQLNRGSKLDLQGGTFVNSGKVVLNNGSTLSAAAAAVNNKQSDYSVTRGENVFVADVNNLSKLENLDHQSGSTIELKNGVFKADLGTANSLGAAIAKGLSSGTAIDSGSWSINNATLQLSNNLDLTSDKLAATGLTATSGSTLATTGNLTFTTAQNKKIGALGDFDKLQGANVTINHVEGNTQPYVWLETDSEKTIAATESLNTNDGTALGVANGLTLELSTNEFKDGVSDITSADARAPESHHVDVDLKVASGGTLNITADPWKAQDIETVSGSELNVLGSAFNSINNEFKTHAALTANNLNLNGIVKVSGDAALTSLGDMTFDTHANAQVSDSSLSAQNININGRANLTNSTASASQTIAVNSNTGSLTANNSQVSAQNFTLSNGAEITFHNNSTLTVHDTLSTEQGAGANKITLDNSDLTAEHILLNTESNLHAINGSQINTDTLRTTNTSTAVQVDLTNSNLTINGDGDNTQADLNIKLSMNGGTLNLGDALDTIGLSYQKDSSNFKVDDNFIKIIANSTRVKLDLTNSGLGSLDSDLRQELYEQLFDSNDSADAYLSLTGVSDSNVTTTKDEDGNIIADFNQIKDESGNIVMDGDADNTREALLTGVDTSKKISGGWKAVQTENDALSSVQVDASKQLNIYGATANGNLVENTAKKAVGVTLADKATLNLESSGQIGDITGSGNVTVGQGQTVNVVASTADSTTSQLTAQQLDNYGDLTVNTVNANLLRLQSSSNLQAKDVTTSQLIAAAGSQVQANNLKTGSANLKQANIETQTFTASDNVLAYGATQINVTDTLELQKGMTLQGDAKVTANNLNLVGGDLTIGIDSTAGKSGSSATLVANTVDLNGNSLILDPEFGQKTATAFIKTFADLSELSKAADDDSTLATSTTTANTATPMQLNGNLIVGRNSALGIGGEQSEFTAALTKLQDGNGSLQPTGTYGKDGNQGVGALLYVNTDNLALSGNKLVVGSEDIDTLKQIASGSDAIYLGNNAGLQISAKALNAAKSNGTQIFTDLDSTDSIKAAGGMLILPSTATSQDLGQIFGEQLKLADGTTIDVQSENGAYKGTIDSADDLHGIGDFAMTQTENTRQILNQMSDPTFAFYEQVRQQVMGTNTAAQASTVQTAAAQSKASQSNSVESSTAQTLANTEQEQVLGNEQSTNPSNTNAQNTQNIATAFVLAAGDESNGLPLEQAARLGTLGVGVQIANQVSQTASDAILQRVGMTQNRNSNNGMTVLDNSKSAAWISPIYQDFSADDFGANNLKYGADIDLYGFAAGFDHTFNNGLRVGAMLNVGGGDANGSGIATGISNDFSYYGAGLYASLQPMRDLTLSADISYTTVDNDLEASAGLKDYGKLTGSVDSTALSAGLNAQYRFNAGGLYITPHAGLRYTRLDLDGYDVKLDGEQLAHADSDSVNVYSIPVGVGISTTLTNGDWIIQPQADFTVTANFGDDEIKSSTTFNGHTNAINYSTEFTDSFTYGAKAGVQVQNGNFSFGANVGYTKSSNTDELGVGLNARFVF